MGQAVAPAPPANEVRHERRRPEETTLYQVIQEHLDLLKETFGQLWSYEREGSARRFFENWKHELKWQRLTPYEKFAEMSERH